MRPVYQLSISECQIELANIQREIEADEDAVKRYIASLEQHIRTQELNQLLWEKAKQLAAAMEILRLLPERHAPLRERAHSLNLRIIEASMHKTQTT